jgi:hypothetical protein
MLEVELLLLGEADPAVALANGQGSHAPARQPLGDPLHLDRADRAYVRHR